MGGDGSDKDLITCEGCGKRYKWKLELAGRHLKCGCGGAIHVPERVVVLEGVYDLFEGEAQEAPPLHKAVVEEPQPGARTKAAGPRGATKGGAPAGAAKAKAGANPDAAAIAERLGIALPTRKRIDHTADVQAGRDELARLSRGSLMRNVIVPVPIILAGLILSFVQVRHWGDGGMSPSDATALGVMFTRAVLSVILMLFTMFLLTTLADINFLGTFQNCILRFCAIAIGPSAVYASLTYTVGGDMGGPFMGAMASIALYGILFWGLMRLDLQDTSICVIVTFSVVMLANYFAFRFAGLMHGSDI
jgi:hypothetical protein